MNQKTSRQAKHLIAALLIGLSASFTPPVRAVGPMGLCPGGKNGTAANCIGARAGWVRFGIYLRSYTSWSSAAFAQYDADVQNYLNNGVQPILLIDNQSYPSAPYPSSWNSNSGGNGDNAQIDDFANNYAVPIIAHYKAMGVRYFEIWNEPNVNGINSRSYAAILSKVYQAERQAGLHTDGLTILGMCVAGTGDQWNAPNQSRSGADYVTAVYHDGITYGDWTYVHNTYGTYPLNGIAQHIYLYTDSPGTFPANAGYYGTYIDYVHNAAVAYGDNLGTYLTEWGFETLNGTQAQQDTNMKAAWSSIMSRKAVKAFCWFQYGDNPGANLYYGIVDNNGNNKQIFNDFKNDQSTFEWRNSDGSVNTYIQAYWNSHGGASHFGSPVDFGGGARVHKWTVSGSSHWGNVQDYQKSPAAHQKRIIIQSGLSGNPTYQVNDDSAAYFYSKYMGSGSMGYFGCPLNDAYSYNGGTRQDFESHYLTWDPTNGTVIH
jgi:hypothetical protein